MKKIFLTTVSFLLAFALPAAASAADTVTVELDGEKIECVNALGEKAEPLLTDGTTYLPVRAVSSALGISIEWDGETKSVLINTPAENAISGDGISIYISGVRFIPKNALGETVEPVLKDGTVYLPIRAVGEAFDKIVSWDGATLTASLTTPAFKTDFDENKTYAIISKASGKAITVSDSGLGTAVFEKGANQAFKFVPSSVNGYYNILSVYNEKNLDVNGNSKAAGANIITYSPGTADNQLFAAVADNDAHIIRARSSKLCIEDSADKIKQNNPRESVVQRWEFVEFEPVPSAETEVCCTLTSGSDSLSDNASLKIEPYDGSNAQCWILTPNSDAEYIVTNAKTGKSLDVANNSTAVGDPIITYQTSGDDNQRWLFVKKDDGTYLIKSVHSSLCLTVSGGKTVQTEADSAQSWVLTVK